MYRSATTMHGPEMGSALPCDARPLAAADIAVLGSAGSVIWSTPKHRDHVSTQFRSRGLEESSP
ncbi:MAG: hypothetical protein JJLCMIEE_00511 [Acidimicrobiales bacterium]|nr:MAG: hypothetical protein EDR02_04140 [Actinomycetota bacterium]MBV6507463.1 hypothetical protein [Acidimicrobiales bacterium]RIK07843.1 MAG: hypothetical protein DCC48_02505 [Acidobacteriota bacterium]